YSQTNASFARRVDAVKSFFLGGEGGFWRVNLEILFVTIEVCESQYERALDETQRDSFITQRDDTQTGAVGKTHKVSRINLDLELATLAGRDCVTLDERVIHAGGFPVFVAGAAQVDLAANQADTRNAG